MRLLLDTHVWLWRAIEPGRVSEDAERALADEENELCLSPISTWETLVLARKGRLLLKGGSAHEWVIETLRRSALKAVPLTHEIALRSERLPGFGSDDPADRFMVATALEHRLTMITADAVIQDFEPVETLW